MNMPNESHGRLNMIALAFRRVAAHPLLVRGWQATHVPIRIFILARIVTWVIVYLAVGLVRPFGLPFDSPNALSNTNNMFTPNQPFINAWTLWDGYWYLNIARDGYLYIPQEISNTSFYPLYSILTRVVQGVVGDWSWAALIVSNLALLGALILLYHLMLHETQGNRLAAARAVQYLAFFPTAYFLFAAYTESLFLLFTVGTFYAARTQRWTWAIVCAMCAAVTRVVGVALVVVLVLEVWRMIRRDDGAWAVRLARVWPLALACAFVPLMMFSFFAYNQQMYGNFFLYLDSQAFWERELGAPFALAWRHVVWLWHTGLFAHDTDYMTLLNLAAVSFGMVGAAWAGRRWGLSYAAYGLLVLAIPFSTHLLSLVRYVLVCFPAFMALALWTEARPAWDRVVMIGFVALLGILSTAIVFYHYLVA
jgi:hypothetical protein